MKFRQNESLCLLCLFVLGCVGLVALTSQLNAMYLNAPIKPAKYSWQEQQVEELPGRGTANEDSDEIVYGNQTPFGQLPDPDMTGGSTFSPPVGPSTRAIDPSQPLNNQAAGSFDPLANGTSTTVPNTTMRSRSVLRPTYPQPAAAQDETSYLSDEDNLRIQSQDMSPNALLPGDPSQTGSAQATPFFDLPPQSANQPGMITQPRGFEQTPNISQPRESFSVPYELAPAIDNRAITSSAPTAMLPPADNGVIVDGSNAGQSIPVPMPPNSVTPIFPHGPNCNCGAVTCVRCCQPRCISRTILVPEWYTVWSSIFETRYKTQIREQAYTVTEEVEHQVPEIQQFTVMVPEPRIRTFQTFRTEAYQVREEEPYTVMVPKPQQRQESVEREEAFKVPVEEQYTVMVPKEKEVTETKYKIVKEKEAVEKKYTVQVPKQKKRFVMEYETVNYKKKIKEPYVVKVPKERTRDITVYKLETETQTFVEKYYEYRKETKKRRVTKYRPVNKTKLVSEWYIDYEDTEDKEMEDDSVQAPRERIVKQPYKVSVPFIEKKYERYMESEPYEETVKLSYQARTQVPRDVTRSYYVRIPYVENVPREYKVRVPYQKMKKGFRTIPKQVPETKYQLAKRDVGRWVTKVCTIPTIEITDDLCGCSTCCPKTRTVRKTIWQPRIVTERIPYTVFKTVKEKVPYEYPVLAEREEIRTKMEPVTKYRPEKREVTITVFDFKPVTKTNTFTVKKFRQVPKTREIEVQRFREEERLKEIAITDYETIKKDKPITIKYRQPVRKERMVEVPEIVQEKYEVEESYEVLVPIPRTRTRVETITVKKPKPDTETYMEMVSEVRYREKEQDIEVQITKPRPETYTVMVPEIRTKIEYIDVERKVPYVETKMVQVMVPEIRTRRIYKTQTRPVSEIKTQTYMTTVPETKTRVVYKTKYRDVPVNRAEIYWENVPVVLKKTGFKTVKKKVQRPRLRRVPVKVPYQVQIRIPHRACRMVPRTITVPVEECCERCTYRIMGFDQIAPQYLNYGVHQLNQAWHWIRDPMRMF